MLQCRWQFNVRCILLFSLFFFLMFNCCALLLVLQVQKTNGSPSVVPEQNEAICATQNKSQDELTTMTPITTSVGDNESSSVITENKHIFSTVDDQPTFTMSDDKHASGMIAERDGEKSDKPTTQSTNNTANSPAIGRSTYAQELPEPLIPVTSGNKTELDETDGHDGSPNSQSEEHSRDAKTILKRNIDDGMERYARFFVKITCERQSTSNFQLYQSSHEHVSVREINIDDVMNRVLKFNSTLYSYCKNVCIFFIFH